MLWFKIKQPCPPYFESCQLLMIPAVRVPYHWMRLSGKDPAAYHGHRGDKHSFQPDECSRRRNTDGTEVFNLFQFQQHHPMLWFWWSTFSISLCLGQGTLNMEGVCLCWTQFHSLWQCLRDSLVRQTVRETALSGREATGAPAGSLCSPWRAHAGAGIYIAAVQ